MLLKNLILRGIKKLFLTAGRPIVKGSTASQSQQSPPQQPFPQQFSYEYQQQQREQRLGQGIFGNTGGRSKHTLPPQQQPPPIDDSLKQIHRISLQLQEELVIQQQQQLRIGNQQKPINEFNSRTGNFYFCFYLYLLLHLNFENYYFIHFLFFYLILYNKDKISLIRSILHTTTN